MASCRKVDSEKAVKYAVAASKGFSYYLPKSAQRHLQELLKQLPSAARSIYDECYRDLMCAKACAPESAVAIVKFFGSFPIIARKHNAFAKEMKKEIDGNEHEGYIPVKFLMVNEPELAVEDASTTRKRKNRKHAPAETTMFPLREVLPNKKAKIKPHTQSATTSTSGITAPHSPSPTRVLAPDLHLITQPQPAQTKPSASPIAAQLADNALPLILGSDNTADVEQSASLDHGELDRQSRHSPPLSEIPSGDTEIVEEVSSREDHDLQLLGGKSRHLIPAEDKDEVSDLSLMPATPPLGDPNNKTSRMIDTAMEETEVKMEENDLDESPISLDSVLSSEHERWVDGMQAIEGFRWDRPGSRWELGRGLVSIHYDNIEKSARLFGGNYWDDSKGSTLGMTKVEPEPEESTEGSIEYFS